MRCSNNAVSKKRLAESLKRTPRNYDGRPTVFIIMISLRHATVSLQHLGELRIGQKPGQPRRVALLRYSSRTRSICADALSIALVAEGGIVWRHHLHTTHRCGCFQAATRLSLSLPHSLLHSSHCLPTSFSLLYRPTDSLSFRRPFLHFTPWMPT